MNEKMLINVFMYFNKYDSLVKLKTFKVVLFVVFFVECSRGYSELRTCYLA